MHAGADMRVHLSVSAPGTFGNFGAKNPDPHRVARSNTLLCIQHGIGNGGDHGAAECVGQAGHERLFRLGAERAFGVEKRCAKGHGPRTPGDVKIAPGPGARQVKTPATMHSPG